MQINVAQAFNPGADDPEGVKKAAIFVVISVVCTLATLLILPGLFLAIYLPGYALAAMRNVATGDNGGKLPEPTSMDCLWHGFISLLVFIVYSLPLAGISLLALGGAVAAVGGAAKSSALVSLGGLASLGIMGVAALTVVFIICCFVPMILLQYCKRNQFGDCFAFGEIFSGILRSPLDYAVVVCIPVGLSIGLSMIPIAGPIVATPLAWLVTANLAGQYGAKVLDMHGASAKEEGVGFNRFE
ncbi:MAG: DUF4013 domain-containing protein [Candidatus Eremiobacteraeota bacterium]|nr:DUF4013 domain-containing protein [Candidatus Eremiobacteraeota bacterium]MCW5871606.1 DUF4013 domain-containing protein [Candidatus Eremiobacteraeota bacterium]